MDAGIGQLIELITDGLRFLLRESGAIDAIAEKIRPRRQQDANMLQNYHKVVTTHVQVILLQVKENTPPEGTLKQFRTLLNQFTKAEMAFKTAFNDELPNDILDDLRRKFKTAFLSLETEAMATSLHLADFALANSTLEVTTYTRVYNGNTVLCMKCVEHEKVRPQKIVESAIQLCPLCFGDDVERSYQSQEHRDVNRDQVGVPSPQGRTAPSHSQYPQSSRARHEYSRPIAPPISRVNESATSTCQFPDKHKSFWKANEQNIIICGRCNSSEPAGGSSPQKSSRISQPNPVTTHSGLPRNSNPPSDQAGNKAYKQMGPGIGQSNQNPSPQTNTQYTTTTHSNPGSYSTRPPPDHSANHSQQTNWKPSFPPTASRHPPSQAPTSHSHYSSPHNSPFSNHHRPTAAPNAHVSSANTYNSPERPPIAASSGGFAQRNPAYPPPQQISRTLSYVLTPPGGSHPPSAAPDVQSNFPTTSSVSRYQAAPTQAISSSSGRGWHRQEDIPWLESVCPHNAGFGCQVCEFGVHSSSEKCDDPAEHARSRVKRDEWGYCWCKTRRPY